MTLYLKSGGYIKYHKIEDKKNKFIYVSIALAIFRVTFTYTQYSLSIIESDFQMDLQLTIKT